MRIFQIGFNKCGTRSLHHFFAHNGVESAHWAGGSLARQIFLNHTGGKPILQGLEKIQAFSDMEWLSRQFFFEAYKLFPYFYREYPDAVFILNTRDRERWIRSRVDHDEGNYLAKARNALRLDSEAALLDYWRRDWDEHHARIFDFFSKNEGRLLVFDIEKENGTILAEKMPELKLDPALYAHRGRTRQSRSASLENT